MGSAQPNFSSYRSTTSVDRSLSADASGRRQQASGGWELRLSLGALIVSWSLIASMMLALFLIGFYVGRDQGTTVALSGVGQSGANLAVVRPIAPVDSAPGSENPLDAAASLAADAKEGKPAPRAIEETDLVMDFSKSTVSLPKKKKPKVAPAAKAKKAPATKPAAKSVAKTAAPMVAATSVKPGMYVQVGTAKDKTGASAIASRLSAKGYSAQIQVAKMGGSSYFRILVGPYGSKEAAEAKRGEIKSAKLGKGQPFVKIVK